MKAHKIVEVEYGNTLEYSRWATENTLLFVAKLVIGKKESFLHLAKGMEMTDKKVKMWVIRKYTKDDLASCAPKLEAGNFAALINLFKEFCDSEIKGLNEYFLKNMETEFTEFKKGEKNFQQNIISHLKVFKKKGITSSRLRNTRTPFGESIFKWLWILN